MSTVDWGKEWKDRSQKALDYLTAHGGEDNMTPEQLTEYRELEKAAQDASHEHDQQRGFPGPN